MTGVKVAIASVKPRRHRCRWRGHAIRRVGWCPVAILAVAQLAVARSRPSTRNAPSQFTSDALAALKE
jgi:hypothetical protein